MFRVLSIAGLATLMVAALGSVTIGDKKNYTRGHWTAYNNPFSKGALIADRDYTQATEINPASFPSDTTMRFAWPEKPDNAMSILGFNQICYGDYYNTVPAIPVVPKRIREIAQLAVSHDLAFTFDDNANTLIYDFFLTPHPRDDAHHLFEIEVVLHAPRFTMHYVKSLDTLGTVAISGIQWTVAVDRKLAAPDIVFVPSDHADIRKGSLDLKAMLAFLVTRGVLTGDEYYNGHAFGIEVGKRSGSMHVKDLSVAYR